MEAVSKGSVIVDYNDKKNCGAALVGENNMIILVLSTELSFDSLQYSRLIRASKRYKLALVYPPAMFGRRPPPLAQISFSPQPSPAIKIKDCGHNFC